MGDKLSGFVFRFGIFILLCFAIYSNVNLLIKNYNIQKLLDDKKVEVAKIEENNKHLGLLINYYKSPSYQETEARRRLNLKMPDETHITVTGVDFSKLPQSGEINLTDPYADSTPASTASTTNIPYEWWLFLTGQK